MSPTAGEFVTETFEYDGGRQVTVYVPPDPAEAVVFAGDGGWHISRLGGARDPATALSTMVVGVHGLPDDDGRLKEYESLAVAALVHRAEVTGVQPPVDVDGRRGRLRHVVLPGHHRQAPDAQLAQRAGPGRWPRRPPPVGVELPEHAPVTECDGRVPGPRR